VSKRDSPEVSLPMKSGPKRLHQKIAGMFTWFDLVILLAAGALGVFFFTTAQGDPNARYIVFWVLLACAAVLIGVKHILASMRRPLLTFAWCLLGGILSGALFWFRALSIVKTHPVQQHVDNIGAMGTGLLYAAIILLSPIAGFLIGVPVTLAIYALFQSKRTGPKSSGKQSDLK
jgi:hypothetical protein